MFTFDVNFKVLDLFVVLIKSIFLEIRTFLNCDVFRFRNKQVIFLLITKCPFHMH